MSDYNFNDDFKKLSDADLQAYVNDRHKYIPEAVAAAVEELQNRGHVFAEEELAAIREEVKIKSGEDAKQETVNVPANIPPINLDDAPELYSKQVITVFAILFSTFFACILMAMNFSRTKNKKGIAEVILFGIGTAILVGWVNSMMNNFSSGGLIVYILGSMVLSAYFWDKYIGRETPYRKRPFWGPLLIGIGIVVLLIYIIFLSGMR
jgi:hypothetical protein